MQTQPDDEQVEYDRWLAARGLTKLLPDSANDMEWLEEIEHLRKRGPLPAKLERLEREIYEEYGINAGRQPNVMKSPQTTDDATGV